MWDSNEELKANEDVPGSNFKKFTWCCIVLSFKETHDRTTMLLSPSIFTMLAIWETEIQVAEIYRYRLKYGCKTVSGSN